MLYQRTLAQEVDASGVGLHRGERVRMVLHPAPEDHGLVFRRIDLPSKPNIKLSVDLVRDTRMSSTLVTDDGVRIGTVEHLLSALAAVGIDNALIDLDAPEVPIMDGSAAPFIYLIQSAGILEQNKAKRYIEILKPIEVQEDSKWVKLEPHEGFIVELTIDFNHPVLQKTGQVLRVDFSEVSYTDMIGRARTFGFMHEVELMRRNHLGLGGSLDNAIVIDDDDILNPDGLRFPNEFVRHKILDAIGDLYVLGHPVIGFFSGFRSGHALNNTLLRKMITDPSSWRWKTFEQSSDVPTAFRPLDDKFLSDY